MQDRIGDGYTLLRLGGAKADASALAEARSPRSARRSRCSTCRTRRRATSMGAISSCCGPTCTSSGAATQLPDDPQRLAAMATGTSPDSEPRSNKRKHPWPRNSTIIEELVTANRILANEGIVDSFGHISVRHPQAQGPLPAVARARARAHRGRPTSWSSRSRASRSMPRARPQRPTRALHPRRDLRERPEIMSVVHNHSPSTIPFGITDTKLKPLLHMCASIGHDVPLWDSHDKFGDTALLVNYMDDGPRPRQAARQGPHRADARPRRGGGRHVDPPRGVRLESIWS